MTQDNAMIDPALSDGHVSRLRQNWRIHEDGALAQRLQSQEIQVHLHGNKQRNNQIRQDFPQALQEQSKEQIQAQLLEEKRLRHQRDIAERDAELARQMALQLSMRSEEEEQKRYEATRDEIFARRLQRLEQQKVNKLEPEPLPSALSGGKSSRHVQPTAGAISKGSKAQKCKSDQKLEANCGNISFHDLRGGVKYNDDQYLVKLARPAMVKTEPVYANNMPEHYAVSNVSAANVDDSNFGPELLGAAGLSQKDLVLSKRVEAQLEQEKKDRDLARRLQDQLDATEQVDDHLKAEIEAKDMELAKLLYEKERAKLKRAKERSRLKKELAKLAQQKQSSGQNNENSPESHSSEIPVRDEDEYTLPSRKPYMNPNVIDTHISSCSEGEPQYDNVLRPSSRANHLKTSLKNEPPIITSEEETPVPPYMPMQHSKMSSSLERRLNKKKDGCKHQ